MRKPTSLEAAFFVALSLLTLYLLMPAIGWAPRGVMLDPQKCFEVADGAGQLLPVCLVGRPHAAPTPKPTPTPSTEAEPQGEHAPGEGAK